jgi:hypothetical protein
MGLLGNTTAAEITAYKNASCGCCSQWVEHMRDAGFEVITHDVDDLQAIKQHYGVSPSIAACHTAIAESYVIEGHVPAADVVRLLEQAPAVNGIAVPGMPTGSPGMEGAYREPYQVITFTRQGGVSVFAQH